MKGKQEENKLRSNFVNRRFPISHSGVENLSLGFDYAEIEILKKIQN